MKIEVKNIQEAIKVAVERFNSGIVEELKNVAIHSINEYMSKTEAQKAKIRAKFNVDTTQDTELADALREARNI